jgi:hypothetical protein
MHLILGLEVRPFVPHATCSQSKVLHMQLEDQVALGCIKGSLADLVQFPPVRFSYSILHSAPFCIETRNFSSIYEKYAFTSGRSPTTCSAM